MIEFLKIVQVLNQSQQLFAIKDPLVDVIGHPDRYTRKDKEKSPEYWQEYWSIWPEILEEMVKQNKAFEINMNSQPSKKLIDMAAKAGVKFFINYDAHDFNQYKKQATELSQAGEKAKKKWAREEITDEDLEILKEYIDPRMINLILAKINSARSYYSNKELIKLDNILFEIYDNTTQLRTTGKINIKNNIMK